MGTTAEKLTYLNGTKRLLRRRLNSLGAEITLETKFRDYLLWLDRFYNAASSGVEFELLGKTEQRASTQSVNILPLYDDEIVTDGITVTVSDGGKVTINGTTTRELWIKITNGMEVEYTSPDLNRGHKWFSEKINEFGISTNIKEQIAIGGGTKASTGNNVLLGYHNAENNSENMSFNQLSSFVDSTMPEKKIKATEDLQNVSETNFVCLHLNSGESFNTYGYIQIAYQEESNWVPNNDAAPASPDNPKYFWSPDDITYKASDGTEFPLYLTYPDARYNFVLGAIGDYKDRIYYKNGKFYCERKIGVVTLNGSEDWDGGTIAGNYLYIYSNTYDNILLPNKSYLGLSNCFKVLDQTINTYTPVITTDSISLGSDTPAAGNRVRIKINKATANTIPNFKTWLSTHPTVVYYVLDEPVITEIENTTNNKTIYNQLKAIIDHETKLEIEKKIF